MSEILKQATIITAPEPFPRDTFMNHYRSSIFLGGSIEQGIAVEWQKRIIHDLIKERVLIFNPRRENWDASWEQDINNSKFFEQVNWELSALERAYVKLFFFDPDTKSPITLMELGLYAKDENTVVYCPPGFYRKGNIDILGQRYKFPVLNNYENLLLTLKIKLNIQ